MATLERCKQWVEDYLDATREHRERAFLRRDYADGIQWTADEAATMRDRGQPLLTYNYVTEKISEMVGAEVAGRLVPRAIGRNPGADQSTAAAITAALRYVTDAADWDRERTIAREQLLVEGVAAVEILVEPEALAQYAVIVDGQVEASGQQRKNPEISIEPIPYDRLFWDPHSQYDDFRDAKYMGSVTWLYVDDARAEYPGTDEILEQADMWAGGDEDEHGDKPQNHWRIGTDDDLRVRVARIWYREGSEWRTAAFCGGGWLQEPVTSPFVDGHGRTLCGMVLQSAHTMRRECERRGIVQDWISPQDDVNKRHSRATWLMTAKQVIMDEGSVRDVAAMKRQLAQPDGVIEKSPNRAWQILDHQAEIQGNVLMLQEAKSKMGVLGAGGIDPAVAGAGAEASGVAIAQRRQAALAKYGKTLHNAENFERRVYRELYHRVRQFWRAPDWVRVTEDDNSTQFLEVNKPITVADEMLARGITEDQIAEMARSGVLQAQGIDLDAVVRVENQLQDLDVDVLLRSAPGAPTYRQDQLQAFVQLAGQLQLPPHALPVVMETVLSLSDIDPRLRERLAQTLQPDEQAQAAQAAQQQQAQAVQQQLVEMQIARARAELEKIQAETARIAAQVDTERTAAIENLANAERSSAQADRTEAELIEQYGAAGATVLPVVPVPPGPPVPPELPGPPGPPGPGLGAQFPGGAGLPTGPTGAP